MDFNNISRENLLTKKNFDKFLKKIVNFRLSDEIDKSNDLISDAEALLYHDIDEHLLAIVLIEKGLNHYFSLSFDKAIKLTLLSINTLKKYADNIHIATCYNNLGVYYSALGLDSKALDYYLKSIKLNKDYLPALNNAGNKYYHLGEYDKAIKLLESISVKGKEQHDKELMIEANTDLAELYIKKSDPIKALKILDRSEKMLQDIKSTREKHFHLLAKGNALMCLDRDEEALELFHTAYKNAKKIKLQELLWFSYKRLISIYEKLKDYKQLSKFYKKSLELQKKINDERMNKRLTTIEEAYEVEKREFHIKQMLEKNARLASIGVMAAGITHEINQPLNAIVINSDGLLYKDNRDKLLSKDYRNSIEQILNAAKRIDEIIKHMRSFWATPTYVQLEAIELHDVIENALSLVNMQVQSHGIIIRKKFCKWNPRIRANKTVLEQILINLVNNSIHSLDSINSKSKKILISTELIESNVILKVQDNGAGIKQENIDRIFDPFFSTKDPSEGMGLGLAIVKNFIKEIKGNIKLVSNNESGAKFEIILPLSNGNKNENSSCR